MMAIKNLPNDVAMDNMKAGLPCKLRRSSSFDDKDRLMREQDSLERVLKGIRYSGVGLIHETKLESLESNLQ